MPKIRKPGWDHGIKPGDRFGKLEVISRAPDRKDYRGYYEAYMLCKCDCGEYKEILARSLSRGKTLSCGCLQKEKLLARNYKHGVNSTQIYHSYHEMIDRCKNMSGNGYYNYGKRGIDICPEWYDPNATETFQNEQFRTFNNWGIMHPTYREGYTIDRLDPYGNYTPENCIWSSPKEQCNNRRNNRMVRVNDDIMTLGQAVNVLFGDEYYRAIRQSMNRCSKDCINSILKPYQFPNGNVLNMYITRNGNPLPMNGIYFIDDYGRPISEQKHDEDEKRLYPALWYQNEFGFVTGPYPDEDERKG